MLYEEEEMFYSSGLAGIDDLRAGTTFLTSGFGEGHLPHCGLRNLSVANTLLYA